MNMTGNENGKSGLAAAECPDERTLGLFVERALDESEMTDVALHVAACPKCKEVMRGHAQWLLDGQKLDVREATEELRQAVRKVLADKRRKEIETLWRDVFASFQNSRSYLAAADGQTGDQIQQETAVRSGFVHFVSSEVQKRSDAWHVKLAFPTTVSDETKLRLQVFDADERPMKSGTLVFCGVELDIVDGYAYISVKVFRENIGVSLIAVKTNDGKLIPGEPVRAYEAGI